MEELELDETEDEEAEQEEAQQDGDDDDPGGHSACRDLWDVLSCVKCNVRILVELLQDVVEAGDTQPSHGGHTEHVGPLTDLVCQQVGSDVQADGVLVAHQGERSTAGSDTVSPGHRAVEVKGKSLGWLGGHNH